MQIDQATVLVTGAARGLGAAFVAELLRRGARTVYAADLSPGDPGARVVPVRLDITDPDSVVAAARTCADTTILINNAGVATRSGVLTGDMANARLEMETHYFGTMLMARAFAPVLRANGGGAMLNVLSAQSWFSSPLFGTYGAAKAAQWSLTNALRLELHEHGTAVSALHVGYMDTAMTHDLDVPKTSPDLVAARALDGVLAGAAEIVADERSRGIKAKLSGDLGQMYPQLHASPR